MENPGPEPGAIQAAIGLQVLGTKLCSNLPQIGVTGLDQFARKLVGVQDPRALFGEDLRGKALATGNAPGQADTAANPGAAKCRNCTITTCGQSSMMAAPRAR